MIEKLKKLVADELMAVNSSHMIERLIQYDFSLDEIKQFFPNMTAEALEEHRNPNAMAFAHWIDKQAQEETAYSKLKDWCEQYLDEEQWYVHPTVLGQCRLTIVDGHVDFFFKADGSLDWIDC